MKDVEKVATKLACCYATVAISVIIYTAWILHWIMCLTVDGNANGKTACTVFHC